MRKGFRLKRNGQVIADGGEIEGKGQVLNWNFLYEEAFTGYLGCL